MGWAELRGMRTNRWKYIRAPKPELYDLVQDPGETINLIARPRHGSAGTRSETENVRAAANSEKIEPAGGGPAHAGAVEDRSVT